MRLGSLQQHPDPPTDGPSRRCLCDLTAVQKTVLKEGANKGRQFWCCPNHESARCKFFEWDDEPPRNDTGGGGGSSGGVFGGGSRIQNGAMDGGGAGECFRCGEVGHWSNGESPNLKGVRTVMTPICCSVHESSCWWIRLRLRWRRHVWRMLQVWKGGTLVKRFVRFCTYTPTCTCFVLMILYSVPQRGSGRPRIVDSQTRTNRELPS